MDFPDPKYRDICSQATLQSSQEGFFSFFAAAVVEKVGEEWIGDAFAKQKTEQDKIRICCSEQNIWKEIHQVLQNIEPVFRKKSATASRESRLQGDRFMSEKNFKKAAMLYSQSVIRAPSLNADPSVDDGLSLPLAYKSRADSLYQLQLYGECLADLHLAIKEGIPNAIRHGIYRKMGLCHRRLRDLKKAKISFEVAARMLQDQISKLEKSSNQRSPQKQKMLSALRREREEVKGMLADLNGPVDLEKPISVPSPISPKGLLPEIAGPANVNHSNASNLLTIKRSADAGRFAVAADHVKTGETLVVEEPYASCLTWKMFSSHCHHCYSRLTAAVPCGVCSGLAFCSEKCRDAAASSYHRYECPFMMLFMGSGMSVLSLLSLRMVTQERLTFFKDLYEKIKIEKGNEVADDKTRSDFTEKESKYLNVYNLVSHSGMRMDHDYFRRTLMAIFLVTCLKKTDYFGSEPSRESDKLSEDEILTASIILRHLQILQFNAHEIYETVMETPGKARGSKAVYTAVGVYPTAALFNHECSPAVTRYFHGKNIVIKSIRPIRKGEMISENYGPIFSKRTLPERMRELTSRYWFTCKCDACAEDWPTIENLEELHIRLRCPTPNCPGLLNYDKSLKKLEAETLCGKCFRKTNASKLSERASQIECLFRGGIEKMDDNNCEEAVPLLAGYLDEIFTLGAPPYREISLCQEALRTCYAQTGNVWVCD